MALRKKPRIIFNDDSVSLRVIEPPHTVKKIDHALRHLRGSQVDVLCWCMGEGDLAESWKSEVIESAYDLADKDESVILERKCQEINLLLGLHRQGIDYLPLLIEQTHAEGIAFYASFRMNDSHLKSRPDGMLASKFWQEHQHYRLWEVTEGKTYYNATLDWSYPEVRCNRYEGIKEVAEKYDIDGVELDFCRNPFIFQPSEAWGKRGILTKFIKDVRKMLEGIGRRRGREIRLIIRAPISAEKLRRAGMDVESWIRHKDMDILVMSCHSHDYNCQVEPWAGLCRKHGVLFYPSNEYGPMCNAPAHNHLAPETVEEIVVRQRGMAQNFLAQKVDGLYMFNFPCLMFEHQRTAKEMKRLSGVLAEVGAKSTLKPLLKQYVFWKDMPIQAESLRPAKYYQTLAFDVRDANLREADTKVTLRFRQVAQKNPHSYEHRKGTTLPAGWVDYFVNGKKIEARQIKVRVLPAGKIPQGYELDQHQLIEITLGGPALKVGTNHLAFHIPKFPEETDPYVYFYELRVDIAPATV